MANYTFYDGGRVKFVGSTSGLAESFANDRYTLRLERETLWELDRPGSFAPHGVQRLSNGNTLVADEGGRAVTEYAPNGDVAWTYDSATDAQLTAPRSAQRLSNGHTLIADAGSARVIEVSASGAVAWSHGGAGKLASPVHAVRLDNGNTLICDPGAGKVVEVTPAGAVAWSYSAPASHAVRLPNGHTLIASTGQHRVVEVSSDGTVLWQFGQAGSAGSDLSHLSSPTYAQRLANGDTVIADSGNGRVLRITAAGNVASRYPASGTTAVVTPRGSTIVADPDAGRIVETGYVAQGRYETGNLDLDIPSVNKWLTRIDPDVSLPSGTSVRLKYSLNGGDWRDAGSGSAFTIPSPSPATFIRVRIDFETNDLSETPELRIWSGTYYLAKPPVYKPPTRRSNNSTSTSNSTTGTAGGGKGTKSGGTGTTGGATGSITAGMGGIGGSLSGGSGNQSLDVVETNVPLDAASMLLSGWVMEGSAESGGGDGTPLFDGAGLVAAAILLGLSYGMGMSSSVLSRAALAAVTSARALATRSING